MENNTTYLVKCPSCVQDKAELKEHWEQLLGYSNYLDKEGNRHDHNPNKHFLVFYCKNCGYIQEMEADLKCWCGWPTNSMNHSDPKTQRDIMLEYSLDYEQAGYPLFEEID